ncbi:MAG TPA: tetratricopeptide repeat protein [Pirellulales bacterium]|nr:tetratricopeptide repeat protein [Pirellulales bacterium]
MSTHLARAQMLIDRSRYEQAIGEIQQHLAEDPNNPAVHAQLALCLSELKKYSEATEEAQLAIHLGPDQPYPHYALAEVFYARNRLKEALAAIEEAVRLDPEDVHHWWLMSRIHFGASRWRPALEAAETGLAIDPENVACNNLRAMCLVKLGRKAEAGATIATALARNPEIALTHANQGWTLLEQRQPQKAMEHFREALRIDPEMEWARLGIVEAMKARHGIYRWMLMWFFWMSRLPTRWQFGVVIGGYFGMQYLWGLEKTHPQWSVWITPVCVVYCVFALMTWIADPLFNLLLRLNRFGRLALSREQVVASNWLGLTLAAAIGMLVWWLLSGRGDAFFAAFAFGLLCIPVSAIYRCRPGKPRLLMASFTIALAAVGMVVFLPTMIVPDAWYGAFFVSASMSCLKLFNWGAIACPWVANVLIAMPARR